MPESIPTGREKIKEIQTLLDAAGLTALDTQIFDDFQSAHFSTFVHGSIVTNELRNVSDIDFAIIGELSKIPLPIRDQYIPGITEDILSTLDYISFSKMSENGRRMSLHIEASDFRDRYPNVQRPYACEYRPTVNVKQGLSNYLLSGLDKKGSIYVMRFTCPQKVYEHGVVNTTPQTGLFRVSGNMAEGGVESPVSFPIETIAIVNQDGTISTSPTEETTWVLGLEFDKMRSDKALYRTKTDDQFVQAPLQRVARAVEDFLGERSDKYIEASFEQLSKYWYARRRGSEE